MKLPLEKYGNRSTVETMMALLAGSEFDDLGIDILASGYLGATLFHIKENAPPLFERIRHVVLPGDFIRGQASWRMRLCHRSNECVQHWAFQYPAQPMA